MHTAPLKQGESATLLAWIAAHFPEVLQVQGRNIQGDKTQGRKTIEGGLLHRLDYETQGLVLLARTDEALTALAAQQEKNEIVKEYDAVSAYTAGAALPGFPPYPELTSTDDSCIPEGTIIESAFRPFGKGRKAVRPVNKGETRYTTKICAVIQEGDKQFFRISITRGFRHQIRCHLAWIKRPLLNDPMYGGNCDGIFLALRASALSFADPENGEARKYCLG
jgi:23S rRNA pseudouridine1911/1915/1917 synthase